MALDEFEAILAATLKQEGKRSSCGTTLLTNPKESAVAAVIILPDMMSSIAGPFPINCGNLCVPPYPGIKPKETSGSPNFAFSEAYLK